MIKPLSISIAESNRRLTIVAPVKDSLHASLLTDRLNGLPYLKVYDRTYKNGIATIKCHTILDLYTIEKLHEDLDTMSDIILEPDEEPKK